MKTLLRFTLLAFLPFFYASCNSGDDEILDDSGLPEYELRISLDNKIHHIYSTDTVFSIIKGNGGYVANVSDESLAKVEIKDTLVYVSFLRNGSVSINILDAAGREKEALMSVYHESLICGNYTMSMDIETTHFMELKFGAGGYKIENIRGTSAELSIEDDKVKAKSIRHGNTHFDIVDKRGSIAKGEIMVAAIYDMASTNLNITMVPDQVSSIRLKSGSGWSITNFSIDLFTASIIKKQATMECDILQIDTYPEKEGTGFVQLIDEENNTAIISVTVQ